MRASDLAWVTQADALGMQLASSLAAKAAEQPALVSDGIAVVPGYRIPLRDVSGLNPERIDMGVDFGGSGPVYALGSAVITNASGNSAGWPGGGWITYKLTDGPDAGLMVYLAEDVTPTVQVGQQVSSATVIGTMFAGGDGIETGWAQQNGLSAESQLPAAGRRREWPIPDQDRAQLRRAAPVARSADRTQPHPGPLRVSSAGLPGHRGVAKIPAGANV